MHPPLSLRRSAVAVAALAFLVSVGTTASAQSADASAQTQTPASTSIQIDVVADRLDQARNSLSPKTGGSRYRIDQQDIEALPQGGATAFNQVLLQAPGVASDSYGQLHVRGDHGNMQYRINGIILPEGISGFGQSLDTRFAKRIDLMTGALPAQYGYRTAGVVEIETNDAVQPGGRIDFYGGSHGTVNPSFAYGNTNARGDLSYYVTGSFMKNNLGIENPAGSSSAIHDRTTQDKAFGYLSYVIDRDTRISALAGSYVGHFQIPNNPGQVPDPNGQGFLTGVGLNAYDSTTLNERQREVNRYAIVALQSKAGPDIDYQVALFTRDTSVHFTPDPVGDLVFNGVAADVYRSSLSKGIQADASYRLNPAHTLRIGSFFSTENIRSDNTSTVFPVDGSGNVTGPAYTVVDNNPKNGNRLVGLYAQDEWLLTDRLTVNYGLRYDQVNAFVDASQWSPRVGLVYDLSEKTTLHAGYARYFTPPPTELVASSSLALFSGTTNASEVTQNSPVQPERSNYLDMGLTHRLTSQWNVGIDGFYKRVSNLIDEGQFGQALIFTPFNYAQGKIYGVELTANYHAGNLSAYGNLSHIVSLARQVNSGQFNFSQDELNYIANNWVHTDHDQTYSASAGLSYLWSGTRYSANMLYGSGLRSGFANTDHLSAYTQVNVGASRRFKTEDLGPLEARVAIVNLFDHSYELRDGSGIGVFAPQYGPRRGYFVGVTKFF